MHGNKKFMLKIEPTVNQSITTVYSTPFSVVYTPIPLF